MPLTHKQQDELNAMIGRSTIPPTSHHAALNKRMQAQAHLKHHMDIIRADRQALLEIQQEHDQAMRHGCAPFQLQYFKERGMIQKAIIHRKMKKLYKAIEKAAKAEKAMKAFNVAS